MISSVGQRSLLVPEKTVDDQRSLVSPYNVGNKKSPGKSTGRALFILIHLLGVYNSETSLHISANTSGLQPSTLVHPNVPGTLQLIVFVELKLKSMLFMIRVQFIRKRVNN